MIMADNALQATGEVILRCHHSMENSIPGPCRECTAVLQACGAIEVDTPGEWWLRGLLKQTFSTGNQLVEAHAPIEVQRKSAWSRSDWSIYDHLFAELKSQRPDWAVQGMPTAGRAMWPKDGRIHVYSVHSHGPGLVPQVVELPEYALDMPTFQTKCAGSLAAPAGPGSNVSIRA
jgi:hypothetical protein